MGNKVAIQNEHGALMGYVTFPPFWRLPAFLTIDGALFQRYGRVSDYHYRAEPDVIEPKAEWVTPQ